jgi:hypothetical protein
MRSNRKRFADDSMPLGGNSGSFCRPFIGARGLIAPRVAFEIGAANANQRLNRGAAQGLWIVVGGAAFRLREPRAAYL